jgi:hypothetical protein
MTSGIELPAGTIEHEDTGGDGPVIIADGLHLLAGRRKAAFQRLHDGRRDG